MLPSPSFQLSLSQYSPPSSRYCISTSSSSSLSLSPLPLPLPQLFPTTYTFSIAIPHRAYIDAPMRTLTRAHSRSRALSTDCLRSLVEFNDLSVRTVSLYLTRSIRVVSLPPSLLPPPLSLSLSLSFSHTRSRTEYRHVSRAPRRHRHFVSRSVSSCLSSFPSVLLPSFSPTYRFLLLLCSPSLPPFLRRMFPPLSLLSVVPRRPPPPSLSLFVSRTDGDAERNGPEQQCRRRRCTHRTVQRWTLMD